MKAARVAADADRALTGNALVPNQVATLAGEKVPKSMPVVVKVTSALLCVHAAPAFTEQVGSAKLAAVAPLPLLTIASVVIQP
jgi:ribose/xylose/arabinose/galactoside ABC-type transport system permease subunit